MLFRSLACLVLGMPKHPRWGRKLHLILLAVLILSQEAYVRPRFLFQFTSPDYYRPPWLVQRVRDWGDPAEERALGYTKAIPIAGDVRCNWIFDHLSSRLPEMYGVREIQGYDPVYPRVYGELMRAWAGRSRAAGTVRHVRIWDLPRRMVDFLGVRFIVGDPSARLCLLPRISLGPGEEKTIRLPESIRSYRLFVRHVCDGMETLPDRAPLGEVIVQNKDNKGRLLPVRYRMDVGDIIAVNPGAARIFRWWPVPTSEGLQRAADYWTQWRIEPALEIQTITFRNVSEVGTWMPNEMVLSDADRLTYPCVLKTARSGTDVYENPSAFPPAWIAVAHRVIPDATERIDAIVSDETDLRTTAILEREPGNSPQEIPPDDTFSEVDFERPSSDEMICSIPEKTTGWLTIAESYSRWWNATIDGKPLPVYRANHAFIAVPLIEQSGTVRLIYSPMFFYAGCLVSGVTLVGCGVVVGLARGKNDR